MTPHQRKDVPPRRDPASDPGEIAASPGAEPAVENPGAAVDPAADPSTYPEAGTYDPAAALVDENQSYGSTQAGHPESGQTYIDPATGQVYIDPATGQAYVEPAAGQVYVDPATGQAYIDPNAAQPYSAAPAGGAGVYGEEFAPPPPPPQPYQGGVYDEAPAAQAPAPSPAAAPTPQRRPATKKKVARRGAPRKTVAGRGVRRPPQRPVYDSGFSLMTVFLGLVAIAMLGIVVLVFQPSDLSGVAGYPSTASLGGEKARNLLADGQRAMIDRDGVLVFSEEEVNRYLNQRLSGEQTGPMSSFVKFRGVYVDFSPDKAEIFIEREFFGMPMTMSAQLRNERSRQQVVYKPTGWTLGKVSLGARNVKPVIDMFLRLRDACIDEYHVLQQMREVSFEENQIALNPVI